MRGEYLEFVDEEINFCVDKTVQFFETFEYSKAMYYIVE